jgi:hypothetical protein
VKEGGLPCEWCSCKLISHIDLMLHHASAHQGRPSPAKIPIQPEKLTENLVNTAAVRNLTESFNTLSSIEKRSMDEGAGEKCACDKVSEENISGEEVSVEDRDISEKEEEVSIEEKEASGENSGSEEEVSGEESDSEDVSQEESDSEEEEISGEESGSGEDDENNKHHPVMEFGCSKCAFRTTLRISLKNHEKVCLCSSQKDVKYSR